MRQFDSGEATMVEQPLDELIGVGATSLHGARKMSSAQRALEVMVAVVGLAVSWPIMLFIACVIALDSRGPVLFFQQRIGRDRKPFRFVKFRTMHVDARSRFPELYAYQYSSETLATLKFKVDEDPRVTRAGVWLRKSSLDELPNLWNVLTGEMALVGPRPEIPEMLPYYTGDMLRKFSVAPGVTGPAQVSGRGRLTFFDTVNFDLEYVEKRCLRYDIKILGETIWKVLRQDGAF